MERSKALNILAKGAGIAAIGMIFSKFMTYMYRLVVARFIGPEAYGQLSLGITVLSISGTISLLALNQAINKYVPEYEAQGDYASIKGVVLSSIHMTLPLSILAGFTIFFGSGFIAREIFQNEGLIPLFKLFAFLVPFANLSSIGTATITAFKKMKHRVFINQISQPLIQLLATVGLVFLDQQGFLGTAQVLEYGVLSAAGGWFAGVVISTFMRFYYMEKLGPVLTHKSKPRYQYRKLINFSGPLIISGIISTVLGWTDTLLLGYFLAEAQVGIYNAALPTAVLIMLPHKALSSLALPSLSEIRETEETEPSVIIKNMARWTFALSFPAFTLIFLFSNQLLHLLFGKAYVEGALVLVVLALSNLISSTTGHLNELIKSVEKTGILAKNSAFGFFLNIVLNLLFIPEWGLGLGILGAAGATLASSIVMNSIITFESYHFQKILPFHKDMWKPVAASIIPLILVYTGLRFIFRAVPLWALIPGGIVFGSLYLLIFVLIGGVNERDRDIIIGVARRFNAEEIGEKIAEIVIR